LAAMATRAQDFVGRADVCLGAGRDRSQSMQVPRIAPDRPMRSLMLPAATFASRRACIPYEGPNVGKGSRPCENVREPRKRRIIFSRAFFGQPSPAFFVFRMTKWRKDFLRANGTREF